MERRTFLKAGAGTFCGLLIGTPDGLGLGNFQSAAAEPFEISLAQWSLHKRHFGRQGPKLDNLDFAATTKGFGINAIEYVNQMFKDKGKDKKYLREMKKRAKDAGVKSLLIMCDGEGKLGDPDKAKRKQAVQNHHQWVEAAKLLGCHSIRVNASSSGSYEEQQKLAADGLAQLSSWAGRYGLNVIVENHGGLSSHGDWLAGVIAMVDRKNCGTLPDFGNFPKEVNRYDAVEQLMPYAKAVSAKSHEFDSDGNEMRTSFHRMMRLVRDAGYNGYVGIEYEGSQLSEDDGIMATKKLLERIREEQKRVQPIFNGLNLTGWQKVGNGTWTVKDGVLSGAGGTGWTPNPTTMGPWLRTKKAYGDFRLELQYMISEKGNSGVFFRSAKTKNPAFTGYEWDILDGAGKPPTKTGPGSIWGVVAPSKNMERGAGHWNSLTIIAKGSKVVIAQNGVKIIDTKLNRSMRGHIGFQNHSENDSVVQFRNIRLEEF